MRSIRVMVITNKSLNRKSNMIDECWALKAGGEQSEWVTFKVKLIDFNPEGKMIKLRTIYSNQRHYGLFWKNFGLE